MGASSSALPLRTQEMCLTTTVLHDAVIGTSGLQLRYDMILLQLGSSQNMLLYVSGGQTQDI
jgi:hypothetical protein